MPNITVAERPEGSIILIDGIPIGNYMASHGECSVVLNWLTDEGGYEALSKLVTFRIRKLLNRTAEMLCCVHNDYHGDPKTHGQIHDVLTKCKQYEY